MICICEVSAVCVTHRNTDEHAHDRCPIKKGRVQCKRVMASIIFNCYRARAKIIHHCIELYKLNMTTCNSKPHPAHSVMVMHSHVFNMHMHTSQGMVAIAIIIIPVYPCDTKGTCNRTLSSEQKFHRHTICINLVNVRRH